ncbi:zinc finger CW-type PWWP domain protein 2 isoform X3 [Mesoplodon densirostris]|uniref:zinc finger CW-type PWWP domain protein 2 isoform X3 n=1 Tax=Mesoplodon densirostris TaxID=48708 RepID=UPI0028DC5956|nr:zinc finger CW-type PWWP domain protein 2 isoform X3 [Mesoplodon densirostris]
MEKGKLNSKMIAEYCNRAMDSSVENNMYVNKVWVQCENESCLKWRLLSSEDAAKVDHNESWYCFMNTDLRYNKCSVSEEDFPEESQLHQSGFKIVYSQLPLGSLVLVKLKNWPSWPGILCPDPFKGKYVTYDLDGDVEQYHIEFLGDPHSRSWIDATFVGHYSITLKPGKCTNKKKWYKSALQEAYLLFGYSHEQRLERCCLSKQVRRPLTVVASPVVERRLQMRRLSSHGSRAQPLHGMWDLPGLGHEPVSPASAGKSKADGRVAVVAKKRMQASKNNTEKKKPKFRKRKRKAILKSSFERVCSDDALSKENMVVKNPPANAGDTGSIPGLRRSHMLRSN